MRKILPFLIFVLFVPTLRSQTNGIVAELRMLGTGTCSSDSGILNVTYLIRPNILRIDLKGPYANGSVIYQPASEKIWILFHFEKLYYSMNRMEMDSMRGMMKKISDDLDARYATMNEKQKAEADAQWKMGNPFRKADEHYEPVKKEDSLVSQLMCKKYRATAENQMARFAYLNDLKSTGIQDEELKILTQFADFIGKGISSLTANLDLTQFRKWNEGAYPIFIKTTSGKNVCHETWMQFIYRMEIRDQDFQIPYDYRKERNPMGNMDE